MDPNESHEIGIAEHDRLPLNLSTFRTASVAALVILIPFNIYFDVLLKQHSPYLRGSGVQGARLAVIDVLFVFIIVSCLPLLSKRSTYLKQPVGQIGAFVSVVIVAIWLAMFPTVEGLLMLVRMAGVFAVVVAIRSMSRKNLLIGVLWPLLIFAAMQALFALAQTLIFDTGMVVPATTLAKGRAWTAGRGLFSGSYMLAAYVTLALAIALSFGIARRPHNAAFGSLSLSVSLRTMMWTTVVLSSAAVATTFGRTALLAIGGVAATYSVGWIVRRRKVFGTSALAVLVPLGVTGMVLRSGWLVRASQSVKGDLTTRDALAARAIEMIQSNPFVGIGPVQYGPNLANMAPTVPDLHVVHNLPLLVSVEFGIVVGIGFTVWIVILGIRAFRLSVFATALFLSIMPFFLLDNLHYVYGNGMAMFAIWLAMLDYHHDARHATTTVDRQDGDATRHTSSNK